MEINREHYLEKMIQRKGNGSIKVVTGVRRCGKSYLMNTIFYRHLVSDGVPEDHIVRFAFDSADDLYLIGEDPINLEKENRKVNPGKFTAYIRSKVTDRGRWYLLLDEVQELDCFEAVLNGYLRKENLDVFVTGSNARFLSRDIITEFAGRGDEIRLYPLSFSEFMSVCPGDKYEGLSQYMLYGGIPPVVLREKPDEKISLLTSLFDEIYIRDILKRNKVRNRGELEDLLSVLSSAVGSRRYYVQSAYSIPDEEKRAKEIRPFHKINDSFKKVVITGDVVPSQYDDHGILTINIFDFLLNPEALER